MNPAGLIERFEIVALAGMGAIGKVYRALDRETGRTVAVKVLRNASLDRSRFRREARALAALAHPAIVGYVADGSTSEGNLYLAMEWLEGEDLATRLKRGVLSVEEALVVLRRVAEGLAHMHERGFMHRDLKPSNIFLKGSKLEDAKMVDFGLARRFGESGENEAEVVVTEIGMLVGTPGYMAPEQARGHRDLDARVDVWAAGCLLYRCIAGHGPFASADAIGSLGKIVFEEPASLATVAPDVPSDVDDFVKRLLSKARDDRPEDGRELLSELQLLDGSSTSILPPRSLGREERRVVCIVLAAQSANAPVSVGSEENTMVVGTAPRRDGELVDAITRFAAEHAVLPDGSIVATITGFGATDVAVLAARCALAIHERIADVPIGVAFGRAERGARFVGQTIERAAELAREARSQIRLDDATAALLDARFEIGRDAGAIDLRSEREAGQETRTVTPFVGRDRDVASLVSSIQECFRGGSARAVVVTGSAGAGKSRLRREALARLEGETFTPWRSRGDPLGAGSAFGLVAPMLRRLANLTPFLAEVAGVPLDVRSVALESARSDAILMRDQIKRAFVELVAAECARAPLLVVLEDVHWGDKPSLGLFDAALRALPDAPLFVLALGRPELATRFPELWTERGGQTMNLAPIVPREAARLVRHVLGETVDDAVVDRVVERAGGNAFFLEESIRAVAEHRGDRLPETVVALAQARLEDLPLDERRLLRAASVFGQTFWIGALSALLPGVRDTEAMLARLIDRDLVVPHDESRFSGERELAFRQTLVREAAYEMLIDRDRTLGHRFAARWLERAGETDALVLAEHYERGNDPERAVTHYVRGARYELDGNDFHAALDRCAAAVRAGASGAELGEALLLEAEAHRWLGGWAHAGSLSERAVALLPEGSPDWWQALGLRGVSGARTGDTPRLVDVAERTRAAMTADSDPAAFHTAARLSFSLMLRVKRVLAEELLDRLDAYARVTPLPPRARAFATRARAQAALLDGDPGKHLVLSEETVAAAAESGDVRLTVAARIALAYAQTAVGEFVSAEAQLRDAITQGDRAGIDDTTADARHNLGHVLHRLGRLEEAEDQELRALAFYRVQGDMRMVGASQYYLAEIMASRGALDDAIREVESALSVLGKEKVVRAAALGALARFYVACGRAPDALRAATEAAEIARETGMEEGKSLIDLALAESLAATGDRDAAREALGAAKRDLLARAARLDPARRETFLAIGENTEILRAAAS